MWYGMGPPRIKDIYIYICPPSLEHLGSFSFWCRWVRPGSRGCRQEGPDGRGMNLLNKPSKLSIYIIAYMMMFIYNTNRTPRNF
jgi:hypothetical protein